MWGLFQEGEVRDKAQDESPDNSQDLGEIEVEAGYQQHSKRSPGCLSTFTLAF